MGNYCFGAAILKISPDPSKEPPKQSLLKPAGYTIDEVCKHTSLDSMWIVIQGNVYDVTSYEGHPGGKHILLRNSGRDATTTFDSIHAEDVLPLLQQFYIGHVITSNSVGVSAKDQNKSIASNISQSLLGTSIPFVLQQKLKVNHDTYQLTMKSAVKSGDNFDLPIGQHVRFLFLATKKNKLQHTFSAPFTPIDYDATTGTMVMLIKVYPHAEGRLSNSPLIEAAAAGDIIRVEGPEGRMNYFAAGKFRYDEREFSVDSFVFICGGTGIAPVYQIVRAVLANASDSTQLRVLYSNTHETGILLRSELDALVAAHPHRIALHYTLTRPPEAGWSRLRGRVSASMVREILPPPGKGAVAMICGPKDFERVCTESLVAYGYHQSAILKF
jgi:nitrate reductase (NAD(P)H)